MAEELLSVGLDVGTTTTQMVVSRLRVENRGSAFSVPEMVIGQRQVIYRSPVYFTPLLGKDRVDGEKLRSIVEAEYEAAGIRREMAGMSRIGFQATEESADLCVKIAGLPNLHAEGLFSHFANADTADLSSAYAQAERFARFDAMLQERGIHIPIRHLNNSAGIMNLPTRYEMVRSGIVTYGMYPSDEVDPGKLPIRPVMQWVTRVAYLKTLPAGRQISYGGTFTTTKETKIATLPVGYADGFRRSLSNLGHVLIRGRKAPVLGRVCMDQVMVDVTDIPDVALDDKVILIGRSGDEVISVEEMAAITGTINYEVVCGLSRRIPRAYYRGGKKVGEVHYLLDNRVGE